MTEVKSRGMKRHAVDAPFLSFGGVILTVTDHRVADGRELHSDLVLQSCHECHPDQGSAAKTALD